MWLEVVSGASESGCSGVCGAACVRLCALRVGCGFVGCRGMGRELNSVSLLAFSPYWRCSLLSQSYYVTVSMSVACACRTVGRVASVVGVGEDLSG